MPHKPVRVLGTAALLVAGWLVFYTMEGIFRTALYRFATTGEIAGGFREHMLRSAYVNKNDRGAWR